MTNKTNKPTLTQTAPKAINAPKALAPKAPKATNAPKVAPKAANTPKALAFDAKAHVEHINKQVLDIASLIRGLNARLETLETDNAVLRGQCVTLETIIVGLQAQAISPKAQVETAPKAQGKAPKADKVETAPNVDTTGLDTIAAFEKVAEHTANRVMANFAAHAFNANVIVNPKCEYDYRPYLTGREHTTFKTARDAAQLSPSDAINYLTALVHWLNDGPLA